MLDHDLAELYEIETKALSQAARRYRVLCCFPLTSCSNSRSKSFTANRSQIVTGSQWKKSDAVVEQLRSPYDSTTFFLTTAFIPFRANTQSDRGTDIWSRIFYFYNFKREEFMAHYHKRSNVESVFQMIKSKFGEKLRSKNETAQINEALIKVLCHNLCA